MPVDSVSDTKVRTVLAELRPRLEALYGDRLVKMVLYGSHARGDARRWSDIDVLVVLHGPVEHSEEVFRTGEMTSRLCLEHNVVLQRLFMDETRFLGGDGALLRNIRREGIEV